VGTVDVLFADNCTASMKHVQDNARTVFGCLRPSLEHYCWWMADVYQARLYRVLL